MVDNLSIKGTLNYLQALHNSRINRIDPKLVVISILDLTTLTVPANPLRKTRRITIGGADDGYRASSAQR